jgi:hypothetical protein
VDINYLFHRRQISLFLADNTASDAARLIHRELAEAYGYRIAEAKNVPSFARAA